LLSPYYITFFYVVAQALAKDSLIFAIARGQRIHYKIKILNSLRKFRF